MHSSTDVPAFILISFRPPRATLFLIRPRTPFNTALLASRRGSPCFPVRLKEIPNPRTVTLLPVRPISVLRSSHLLP